jgi:hypothetical protein
VGAVEAAAEKAFLLAIGTMKDIWLYISWGGVLTFE